MENGIGAGGGGGGGGGSSVAASNNQQTLTEIDFQRLAQIIATSIQKIFQNGKWL